MLSDKHREEEVEPSPFDGLQKNAVLHEARVFHERELDPSQCRAVLTRLLFLLSRGEEFVSREATEVFFGVTKLFQSPDVDLRRLIYLMIKELSACVGTDESLIVVQCLSKDMAGTTALFRANAIRVLAKIIDGTMLGQIERFMKQAIVDKETFVSSSAIVAGLHLYEVAPDVVKRWGNEVQEVLKSGSAMAQYHAMLLLHKIKQTDRMAVNKMVSSFVRTSPRGYMAQVLLVRYIANVLARQNPPDRDLHRHLVDFLRDKDEVVMFEAARAICLLPSLPPAMLAPAIETLRHDFLNSDSIYRFAGVRLLSQVVARYPQAVAPCSPELERLLTDANRNVATLAITCLLKTGVEASVDRLMKSLSGFMNEISEEFKVVLVDAVKTLCLKFPHKHGTLMAFLSTSLREEGGAAYKRALVYAMLDLISNIEAAKEHGLDHFCEFIEDCEYLDLSIKILHLLGEEGPKTSNPARYIRFIFNRIILEAAPVRAAAVSSLAKFGAAVPALTDQVIVLLERAKEDNDDEVRDRVVFYLDRLTKDRQAALNSVQPLPVNVRTLEHSLRLYLASPDATAQPFNLDAHVVELEDDEDDIAEATDGAAAGGGDNALAAAIAGTGMVVANPYLDVLNSIPEFAEFGELFKSCKPVALTEEEAEYRVSCVKHIYAEHVVFQFLVRNNLDIMQLENINVSIDADEDAGWHEALEVSEPVLTYGAEGSCFVALARPGDSFASDPMPTTLNFTAKEVDVDSGEVEEDGLEDSYELEDVEVTEQDFVTHGEHMGLVKFRAEWEALGNTHEARKKYSLGLEDLQGAVDAVIGLLGMQACEDSGTVPEDKRSHAVNLYGLFVGNVPVFARAGFQLDPRHGVSLRLAVRSSNPEIGTLMVNAIR